MGLLTGIGLYAWGRSRGRRHERQLLDEQAERQRLRAPEPFDAEEHIAEHERLTDGEIKLLLAIPVTLLVIFGMVTSWTAFWIGVGVLFVVIGATVPLWIDEV